MVKCREISRLTKVPRFTSILWRNQTPGSPQSVFDNSYGKLARIAAQSDPNESSTSSATTILDPFHPATKLKPQQLPSWQGEGVKIKLVPMGILQKPLSQCSGDDPFSRNFVSWAERIEHARKAGMTVVSSDLVGAQNQRIEDCDLFPKSELGNKRLPAYRSVARGPMKDLVLKKLALRIPMSYLTATSKDRMGSKTHMRRRITTRIKTALNLIVTRGAYVDQSELQNGACQVEKDKSVIKHNPLLHLRFDDEEARLMGEKWIMQGTIHFGNGFYQLDMPPFISTHLGWSYIFYPTTEIYNMPYPKLVTILRQALKSLYNTATRLERRWLKEALLSQSLLPRLKHQKNPSRTNKEIREKATNSAYEPSTYEHRFEMSDPSFSPDSAYSVFEKPQNSGPHRVHSVESPTAVEGDDLDARLLSGLLILKEKLEKRIRLSFGSVSKHKQTDPNRTDEGTPEWLTKSVIEPSTYEQVEMAIPSSSGSACNDVKKPRKSGVHRLKNPTAVNPELWESQLLSGLAIMQERLGK